MNTALIILISIVASVIVTTAFFAITALVIWHRLPRIRLRLQKFLLTAPHGSPGVHDPKLGELEQRLNKLDKATSRQSVIFNREVETGKRAENAMVDILKGLTRSALRTDERLKSVERKDS
ncbi:MAG: hypothetical protein ACREKL_16735 [Chthoniobacterales bacterium]